MFNQTGSQWQAGDSLFKQYKVTAILGQDSLGEVYKANHLTWKTDLVIRKLKPDIVAGLGGMESLRSDLEGWINLGLHPHIVSCYYLRHHEGVPLLFTEYVSGSTLRNWITERRLYGSGAIRRMLDIAIQLAWSLDYAHEKGITHQDVKPEAVQITPKTVVKLSDFGLARAQAVATQGTSQLLHQRTDVSGWGLTVLEMFIGAAIETTGLSAAQVLENYLKTGAPDPQIPLMPEQVARLLHPCFQESLQHTINLRQATYELQALYQTVTGCPYPRQKPEPGLNVDHLNNRALCLWDLGKSAEAFAAWEQALTQQPQHPESVYNQGLLRWRAGAIDDCTLLQQLEACQSNPADQKPSYFASLVQLERGDYQSALRRLEQLTGLPDEFEPEVEAALALARAGQPARQFLRYLGDQASVSEGEAKRSAIALSADGRFALSTGVDRIKLWQVETGKRLSTFKGHQGQVTAVTFSPDGYYIVSGSEDRTLKLWNVTATDLVHTFDGLKERQLGYQSAVDKMVERISIARKKFLGGSNSGGNAGHLGTVLSIDFSPDRQYLLSGSEDTTVKLWDVQTGRCVQTFKGHRQPVFKVLFSPDREHVLSASTDQTIKFWELATGRLVQTLQGFQGLTAVAFLGDGQQVLTADGELKVWDAARGEVVRAFADQLTPLSRIASMAVDAEGQYALTANAGQLKLWEVATGRCLRTFEGHNLDIQAVSISENGRYALSMDADSLRLWSIDCKTATPLAPLHLCRSRSIETVTPGARNYDQSLLQAQLAIEQNDFVTAAQQLRQARSQPGYGQSIEALQAWFTLYPYLPRQALNQVWEQTTFVRHTGSIHAVCFSPEGRFALSGSADQTLKLWDIDTGRCLLNFEGHRGPIYAAAFNLDGTYALSGSADKMLKIWNVQSGECVWTLEGHRDLVYAAVFSPDGRFALSGSADKTCKLWDTAAGYCLRTFDQHTGKVMAVAFSPNGREVLSGSTDKTLRLWNVATGDCIRTLEGHKAGVRSVGFSADGRYALSGSADNTLKLWNVNSGECIRTLEGHKAAVRSIAFSGDGRYALSGSDDNTLKLWNVNSGECIWTLEGHKAAVQSVTLSGDGRYILSGSDDNTLKLWTLDWQLTDKASTAWDEAAKPYLEAFLALHSTAIDLEKQPGASAAVKSSPTWSEADFHRLIRTLQQAGYGWLQPEGVRQQLMLMTQTTPAKPVLQQPESTEFATAFATEFATEFATSLGEISATVTLSVIAGSLQGQEFVFHEPTTCIVGRAKDCHLQLPNDAQHNTVSRYHCALDINPPTIRIRDLGSLHGTYVNGQIIGRRPMNQNPAAPGQSELPDYPLTTGDEIQLGKTVLRVTVAGAVSEEPKTSFDRPALIDQTVFPFNNQHE